MKALRGLAAILALLALVVGVPVLLALAVGWPLPRTTPVWSDITSTIAGDTPLDADVVWNGLAVIVWIGWTQLAVAVTVELLAGTRGRVAAVLPGGFGPAQALAAWLLGTAGALLPSGPTVTPAEALPQAAEARALATIPTPTVATHSSELSATQLDSPTVAAPANIDHVVARRDTLWDLAETYLAPSGSRDDIAAGVQQIFDANVGRPQPDGSALTDASLLRPGWVLTIPTGGPPPAAPAVGLVTVERGDSLWEIAEEQLGDGHAWPAIAEANYGRPQPDGRTLTDPNVLEAGWQLEIPQPVTDITPVPQPAPTTETPTPAPPAQVPPAEPPASASPTIPPTAAPATATTAVPSSGTDAPAVVEDLADESDAGSTVPWGLAGGGLATAGLLAILDRRRRAQLRHREPGRRVRLPDTAVDLAERTLRAGADPARADLVADVVRAASTNSPAGLPTLNRVEIDDDTVALVLDEPAPPPPGFDPAGPARWERNSTERLGAGADLAAPVPALVPIGGTENGTDVLIDLEATAVTQVTGEPGRVTDLLHAVAVAAATGPWTDQPHVLTVGAPPTIAEVPGIEPVDSFAAALDLVEAHRERIAAGLRSAHLATTAQARATGTAPDAWETLVLISTQAPEDSDATRLQALVDTPGHGVAVICPATPGSTVGRDLTVTSEGLIAELEGATAHQLATDDLAAIAMLLQSELELDDRPRNADGVDADQVSLEGLLDDGDVVVRVLGEVDARRRDGDEQLTSAKQKGLEAIVYLAVRDGSVDREDVQAALWPTGANAAKTFVNAMSDARRTLAASRDGSPLLPSAEDGRYHLSSRVVTDYEVFCRLTAAADDIEDASTAAELLADALTLVRGEPFTGAGRGYAWVAPHRGMVVAQVVDAAEELAEVRLATGDWRGAEWAARQGLRAFPADERLYRILMRAAHRAGSLPGVHRAYQELLAAVADPDDGCEPEDTVHPETVQLLESLTASTRPDRATA